MKKIRLRSSTRHSLGSGGKATADKENPDELAPSGFDDLFYQLTF